MKKKDKERLELLETKDTKYCPICQKIKPLYDFGFTSRGRKFAVTNCTECQKGIANENHVLRNYGITLKDYDKMLKEQNGECWICGIKTPGGNGRFHIDHDHKINGKKGIRGLLCMNCNRLLGHAKDDIEILAKAITYLSRKQ